MREEQYAMILAQVAMMNCEVAGMVAENQIRPFTYSEKHFQQVSYKYMHVLGFNEILSTIQEN